jgi:SAM-dependent methyltransferase
MNANVIWHDLECGTYREDLALWLELADTHGSPILDIGAGTGRVTLELARAGHQVTALDRDEALLTELAARADGLAITTVLADARDFSLAQRFALGLVPMQTVQLLGGREGRVAFLRCARAALVPGGLLVLAIAEELDEFDAEVTGFGPLPDICERDGVLYSSYPTAVRIDRDGFVLERRRECVRPNGTRFDGITAIRLDRVQTDHLEREGRVAGLTPAGHRAIAPTRDYVGSEVVMLRA